MKEVVEWNRKEVRWRVRRSAGGSVEVERDCFKRGKRERGEWRGKRTNTSPQCLLSPEGGNGISPAHFPYMQPQATCPVPSSTGVCACVCVCVCASEFVGMVWALN